MPLPCALTQEVARADDCDDMLVIMRQWFAFLDKFWYKKYTFYRKGSFPKRDISIRINSGVKNKCYYYNITIFGNRIGSILWRDRCIWIINRMARIIVCTIIMAMIWIIQWCWCSIIIIILAMRSTDTL